MSASSGNGVLSEDIPGADLPETEVRVPRRPRKFTVAFKRSILKAAAACTQPGELGALLRREGLYYATISDWKRQRDRGRWDGSVVPPQPGPTPDGAAKRIAQLERENRRLTVQLEQANTILSVQKKLSELLGIQLSADDQR